MTTRTVDWEWYTFGGLDHGPDGMVVDNNNDGHEARCPDCRGFIDQTVHNTFKCEDCGGTARDGVWHPATTTEG